MQKKPSRKFSSEKAIWGVPGWHKGARPWWFPRICLHPNARNLKCYLIWKKVLAEAIRLRILRWGDYPGLSLWALNATPRGLMRERPEVALAHTGEVKAEQREMAPTRHHKLEKARNEFSPRASEEGRALPMPGFRNSGLQKCGRINYYCCKPPSWWRLS